MSFPTQAALCPLENEPVLRLLVHLACLGSGWQQWSRSVQASMCSRSFMKNLAKTSVQPRLRNTIHAARQTVPRKVIASTCMIPRTERATVREVRGLISAYTCASPGTTTYYLVSSARHVCFLDLSHGFSGQSSLVQESILKCLDAT